MEQATPHRSPAFWPLALTGVILLLVCASLWVLWAKHAATAERLDKQAKTMAELEKRRDELNAMLMLEPCEAQKRLERSGEPMSSQETPASQAAPTEPQTRQKTANATANPALAAKVKAIENACVFVVSSDGKKSLSTGSGFFVAPGHVLTNRHVVDGNKRFIMVTSKSLGHPARARLLAASKGNNEDYALLKVDIPPGAKPCQLPFAKNVRKTEKVGAWGFPDLVGRADPAYARLLRGEDIEAVPELSYSEGVVSAVLGKQQKIIVHTAPISPGNSGGPLVNESGEVVGINTMITLDGASYRQASLALAAPDIVSFLGRNGIHP